MRISYNPDVHLETVVTSGMTSLEVSGRGSVISTGVLDAPRLRRETVPDQLRGPTVAPGMAAVRLLTLRPEGGPMRRPPM
jgi:hypothetical protein